MENRKNFLTDWCYRDNLSAVNKVLAESIANVTIRDFILESVEPDLETAALELTSIKVVFGKLAAPRDDFKTTVSILRNLIRNGSYCYLPSQNGYTQIDDAPFYGSNNAVCAKYVETLPFLIWRIEKHINKYPYHWDLVIDKVDFE